MDVMEPRSGVVCCRTLLYIKSLAHAQALQPYGCAACAVLLTHVGIWRTSGA